MNHLMKLTGLFVVGVFAFAQVAPGQSVPLPDALRAHTDAELGPVLTFALPSPSSHETLVSAGYNNTGTAQTVSMLWRVRHGDASPLLESRVESLAYAPLALTSSAGITNRMYVAGMSRDGKLVLEQWSVPSPTAVAQAMHPTSGAMISTASIPRVVRTELARLEAPGPVWSIAVNPHGGVSGRLLLLSYKNPAAGSAEVWEFDLETRTLLDAGGTGAASPLWTEQSNPVIANRSNLWAANIPALGFVILVTDDKPYRLQQRARYYSFFIDSTLDGSYEAQGQLTRTEFLQAHPHSTWAPFTDP
jgi:hypothetical protein